MKKKATLFVILIIVSLLITLTGCTKKVENQPLALNLPQIGERNGTYTGEMKSNMPNGQGKFISKNPQGEEWYYEGNFSNGMFDGQGKSVHGKIVYEGTFEKGLFKSGKHYINNILIYEGDFTTSSARNIYNGNGKMYNAKNEVVFEGVFENNRLVDKSSFVSKCQNIPYESIARDENTYKYNLITLTGKVIQVIESDASSDGLVQVSYRVSLDEDYNQIVFVDYLRNSGETRILEDDVIIIYGQYNGLTSYETVMGGYITIPSIYAHIIDLTQ